MCQRENVPICQCANVQMDVLRKLSSMLNIMCIKQVIIIIRTISLAGCFGFLISLLRATFNLSYSSPIGTLAYWHITLAS